MDRIAAQATGADPKDAKNHLAKVRVAGSNPVVRSRKGPGQGVAVGPTRAFCWARTTGTHHICTTFFRISCPGAG
jgi:hypothetical protein